MPEEFLIRGQEEEIGDGHLEDESTFERWCEAHGGSYDEQQGGREHICDLDDTYVSFRQYEADASAVVMTDGDDADTISKGDVDRILITEGVRTEGTHNLNIFYEGSGRSSVRPE